MGSGKNSSGQPLGEAPSWRTTARLGAAAAGLLAGLPLYSFDVIMVDPPWNWRAWSKRGLKKSPQAHYKTMSFEEIAALPIGTLAAVNCYLFLWATWPFLLDGGDPGRGHPGDPAYSPIGEIMKAWGFRYATGGSWLKRTSRGKLAFGPGYRLRNACDPFLIGIKGEPGRNTTGRNVIEGLAREHSRKPEDAYLWCETHLPGTRRLDLFSRQVRVGWTGAGDELDKFEAVA